MSERSGKRWDETKKAWDEVAKHFSEVGRKVGEQYRKLGEEAPASAEATGGRVGDAVRDAVDELDQALTSVGDTLRDPEAKESLRKAVGSFGDAISATFTEVGEELRKQFGSGSGRESSWPIRSTWPVPTWTRMGAWIRKPTSLIKTLPLFPTMSCG